jgi:uncharacterized RDD family membrane protein YckC
MTDTELQQKRLIAAAIDGGIAIALAIGIAIVGAIFARVIAPMLGALVGILGQAVLLGYILLRDIIGGDRSLGKKTQEIRVVTTNGAPVTAMDSIKRNAIFAIGSALGLIWAMAGLLPLLACLLTPLMLLGSLISLVAVIVEIVKVIQDPAGVRFGDQFASTRVTR